MTVYAGSAKRCVVLGGPRGYLTVRPVGCPMIADRYARWTPLFTINRPLTPQLADAAKDAALRCSEQA